MNPTRCIGWVGLAAWVLGCGGGTEAPPDVPGDAVPVDLAGPGDVPGDPAPDGGSDSVETPGQPDVEALVAAGIRALGLYAPDLARDRFLEAIEVAPDDFRPRYGLILAEVQKGWQLLDTLVAEIAPPGQATGLSPAVEAVVSPRQDLADFLEGLAHGLTDLGARQIDRIDALLERPGDLALVVPALPLRLGTLPFLEFHGEWDRADLHWIRAGQQLLSSIFLYLRAHSFQANLLSAIDVANLDLGGLLRDLPALLAHHPGFLALRPEGGPHPGSGAEDFRTLNRWLARAGEDARAARAAMADEIDDQTDDVFSIGPEWILSEGSVTSTRVRVRGSRGEEAIVLWDARDVSVARFFEAFEAVAGGPGGRRLSLTDDVVPTVATMLDVVRQTVGIGSLAGLFGASLGDLSTVVETLDELDPNDASVVPRMISDLLGSMWLPKGILEFDLGSALSRPLALRDVLPAWTGDDPVRWDERFDCPVLGALEPRDGAEFVVGLRDPDGEWRERGAPPETCFVALDDEGTERDRECVALAPDAGDLLVALVVAEETPPSAGDGRLQVLPGTTVEARFLDDACSPPVEVRVTWKDGVPNRPLSAFTRCWDAPTCDRPHRFPGALRIPDPPEDPTPRPFGDLPADGWASPFPIRAWRSPSWNGAFWTDPSAFRKVEGAPPPEVLGPPGPRRLEEVDANWFFPLLGRLLGL